MQTTTPKDLTPPYASIPSYMTTFQSSPVNIYTEQHQQCRHDDEDASATLTNGLVNSCSPEVCYSYSRFHDKCPITNSPTNGLITRPIATLFSNHIFSCMREIGLLSTLYSRCIRMLPETDYVKKYQLLRQ